MLNLEALHSLAILFKGEQIPSQKRFKSEATEILNRYNSVQALEWIPRVPHPQRADYESRMKEVFPEFEFTERLEQGKMVKAGERNEYLPVYYLEPYIGNEAALGFDLASSQTRLEALMKSRDSGIPQATASIALVQEKGRQKGFSCFLAGICR